MNPPPFITQSVSLADKNWFKTGGRARFFAEPRTVSEFQDSIAFAHAHSLPIFVLGAGANILISDSGFDGLVIRPQLSTITHAPNKDGVAVTAGAGVHLDHLIKYCLDHQLIGLEEFSGIPGTVGGSVFINAHYFEFLLEHFLVQAQVINAQSGEIVSVDCDWFQFGYDQSRLHHGDFYLVSATFAVRSVDHGTAAYAKGRRDEMIRHRVRRYPTSGTCGSFFRNFHDDEVTLTQQDKKMIYVAYYLDKVGIKGNLVAGGAGVSYQHANMIVNGGNATSADIVQLARMMQQKVHDQFGVLPKPECLLIGFDEYPLLKESDV